MKIIKLILSLYFLGGIALDKLNDKNILDRI
jgi:hypothetical protein